MTGSRSVGDVMSSRGGCVEGAASRDGRFAEFDDPGMRDARSFDEFREGAGRLFYDVEPASPDAAGISVACKVTKINDLLFSETTTSRVRLVRTRKHLKLIDPNFIRLRVHLPGKKSLVAIRGQEHIIQPGDVSLIDFSQEFDSLIDASWQIGVFLPHQAIGLRPSLRDPILKICNAETARRILRDTVATYLALPQDIPTREGEVLENAFCGLLRGLISAGVDSVLNNNVQEARAASMRTFLDERLTDPSTGFESVAAAFAASRATIYRDFADVGGVSAYIQRRRLEKAFDELSSSDGRRGIVSRAAERWQFSSPSHFNRAFRKRYGVNPGEIVGTGLRHENIAVDD